MSTPTHTVGLPWAVPLAGRLDEHVFTSEVLRDNPLGDPSDRPLWVYALRPFITTAVWSAAVAYRLREAWRQAGYVRAKRSSRAVRRAWYEGRQQLARRLRRVRKPLGAIMRGAVRRLARKNA